MISLLTAAVVAAASPSPADPAAPSGDRIAPVVVRVVAATPPATTAAVVCRTTLATGSLVTKHKACLTARQWDYVDQANRDAAQRLVWNSMGGMGQE